MTDASVVQDVRLFKDDNELLKKYQDVFVQSILTSFGLDALFFGRTDQVGGTVDTVNNARQGVYSKQYGNEEKYKKHMEAMGDRLNRDAYNKNEDFIEKGREYKRGAEDGTLRDGYTGRPLTSHDNFDREHIISVYEIEKDAGRILAGIEGDHLASADSNLTAVDRSINRSKKHKSVKEWLDDDESRRRDLKALEEKSQREALSDEECKLKENWSANAQLIRSLWRKGIRLHGAIIIRKSISNTI